MWEAIRWFCNNGYKSLCFGRTESENTGLRQFKAGWGTEEQTIKYSKYDLMKSTFIENGYKVSQVPKRIFQKMPLSLLNILGSVMYRHIG